jgi:hypothetical protein
LQDLISLGVSPGLMLMMIGTNGVKSFHNLSFRNFQAGGAARQSSNISRL